MRWLKITTILAAIAVAGGSAGTADSGPRRDHDHDRARDAFAEGRIVSLRTILDAVEAEHDGELLEVELEEEHGRFIYEVKILTSHGRIIEAEYDARTGRPLGGGDGGARRDDD